MVVSLIVLHDIAGPKVIPMLFLAIDYPPKFIENFLQQFWELF
jgi:hypothetical protein